MVLERDAQGRPLRMVGTHTDISERKAMEERLKLLATSDPLTGLANRRHFLERLREEWARTQRYPDAVSCVLMADLDHFKQVNDRFGHAAGDLALQEFARILEQTSRETDLCGRLGGEEFAVLLPQTNGTEALLFAHRLGKRLRENVLVIDDQPLRMTVSLGISPMRPGDRHPEEALQRADAALYQAKHDGRDRAALAP
jgi:diguanylate cyclase (GGDEF)-like protein